MGLIGPNEAGKSTIVKAIINLVRIDGGSIRVCGMDHREAEQAVRETVGYVGEEQYFYTERTVRWKVNSAGDEQAGVDIISNTGHGDKTNYQLDIEPQAKVHLEASEYVGSGAERKRRYGCLRRFGEMMLEFPRKNNTSRRGTMPGIYKRKIGQVSVVLVFMFVFSLVGLDVRLAGGEAGGVPVAEASGTQPIGNLSIGDRVVDNSWEWEHRTGPDSLDGVPYSGTGESKPPGSWWRRITTVQVPG